MDTAGAAERVLTFAARISWVPTARYAAICSIGSAALLFGAIGAALAWRPVLIIAVAVLFALSTWLAGSLARAIVCLFGSLGFVAAILATGMMLDEGIFSSVRLGWSAVVALWLAVTLVLAFLWRRSRPERAYELTDLVGVWVSISVAVAVWRRVDMHANHLRLLVKAEDNEAWIGLVTQLRTSTYVGPGFVERFDGRGPVIATVVGILGELQQSAVPPHNAAFAAWALAVLITPFVAVGLMRACGVRHPIVAGGFAIVLIGWAWFLPLRLFDGFGHLTATWAFLFVLVVAAAFAFDEQRAGRAIALIGAVFCAGTVWYPIFPLALIALGAIAWRSLVGDRGAGRLAVVAAAAAMATVVALQMAQSIGLIGAPPEVSSGLQTLYAAQGGTQALDGTLSWLAPLALVALAFTALTRRGDVARLWRAMVVAMVYVLAVFAGAYVMEVGLGYGPTKVWFILGFSMAVGLVAIVPRFTMPPRAVAASLVVLAVGSVVFGGAGFVLSRSWPGPGDDPAWLAGLERVAATEDPLAPRPIACLSADKYQAYFCTRWGAGLSTGLDKPFVDYRLQVMADQDPTATVDQLIESGDVADAKLIVIDLPPADRPWAWKLIGSAGEVYAIDGTPFDPRPTAPVGS